MGFRDCRRYTIYIQESSSYYLLDAHYLLWGKRTNELSDPNYAESEKFFNGTNCTSRSFKCELCNENFEQKHQLLTHYNSVAHLHKAKKMLEEQSNNFQPSAQVINVVFILPFFSLISDFPFQFIFIIRDFNWFNEILGFISDFGSAASVNKFSVASRRLKTIQM